MPHPRRALASALIAAALALFAILFALKGPRQTVFPDDAFEPAGGDFEVVSFADLDGWSDDAAGEALAAFVRSCPRFENASADAPANPLQSLRPGDPPGAAGLRLLAGVAGDWAGPCATARRLVDTPYTDEEARRFFEAAFAPLRLLALETPKLDGPAAGAPSRRKSTGLFTAYFEPVYPARAAPEGDFTAPALARPADLVMVELGAFRPELAGQRIAGRVEAGALKPFEDRAAIEAGALSARAPAPEALAYLRPTDLFFLQIQGSGRLRLPDGEIRLGYDGQNGWPYTAIGKTLIDEGVLTRETVSMQTIRAWLDAASPAEAGRVRAANASYVFFRTLDAPDDETLGPPGAAGVALTPGRSIAIDPRYAAYGAPVYLSAPGDPAKGRAPVRRLMIAQDTGGAIKGPVRGDLFLGSGEAAGEAAGVFREEGELFLLTPKAAAARLAEAAS